MVFRPPPRETIELLHSVLHKLEDEPETDAGDLAYLRQAILDRIAELESAQKDESGGAGGPASDRRAA